MGPARLSANRREELRRALDILGAGPPRLLGYVDSGTAGDPGNDDEASFRDRSYGYRPVARFTTAPLTLIGDVLQIGWRLVAPVLLGLIVLSIRGRVKR